jgi:hypothetical protein
MRQETWWHAYGWLTLFGLHFSGWLTVEYAMLGIDPAATDGGAQCSAADRARSRPGIKPSDDEACHMLCRVPPAPQSSPSLP